ncbi:MAG TPA: hypothetical protein DDY46_02605 [Kocuria sp.]|nr:hypothetical protein [Kocuria sp.]
MPLDSQRCAPGATFDDVLELCGFDRQLRLLVLDAVERVEVAVRASMADVMSMHAGGSHWHTDPRHFRNRGKHPRLLGEIRGERNQ